MSIAGPADLCAAIGPLAEEMIPGWRVTCVWCDPADIGGALAMVFPDELRERAVIKVAPHPAGEDIGESVAHELVHATVRPLVALIPESPATIQIEETIAERLGVLIARLWRTAPARARAVIRALQAELPTIQGARARAKISALAHRRARGENMDPIDLILAAVEAAAGADDPKEALAALLGKVRAIKDGTADHTEPDGDEQPGEPMAKDPNKPADPLAAPPPAGDMRARLAAAADDAARMRASRLELDAILADSRKGAVAQLVTSLRARLPADHKGLPATEKDILAAPTYQDAKRIHDLAIRFAPEPTEDTGGRARGADGRITASPKLGAAPEYKAPADAEKFDPSFLQMHRAVHDAEGTEAAEKLLIHARARLSRDTQQGRA